jgi:hypothetical protein
MEYRALAWWQEHRNTVFAFAGWPEYML